MSGSDTQEPNVPKFGEAIRAQHFSFAHSYRPLNHGSFGVFPRAVHDYQRQLQSECEARPDTFIRYTYLELLSKSRQALAPLLGAHAEEVVMVPNATTGVNTVLRNLCFEQHDVIITFSSIYGACNKTIQSLSETGPASCHQISITYPIRDEEILDRFHSAVTKIRADGKNPRVAMFDTVLTFPGARFPWEALVAACRELDILSFIDGAHGVGHIDLTHLGEVGPDFFISNCYKWLMVPRGCAVLYVPFRNQESIVSTYPTSWGFEAKDERDKMGTRAYFARLFNKVSTTDNTPYCCVPEALRFRAEVCGGEASIRAYCEDIARRGGDRLAEILGTEVLGQPTDSMRRCCFVNVRLPLTLAELNVGPDRGREIAKWMQELTPAEYETYIPIKYYAGQFWCRISGQIYLTVEDFEWAAGVLLTLCRRAKSGEWMNDPNAAQAH